jgi:hypothetical protein
LGEEKNFVFFEERRKEGRDGRERGEGGALNENGAAGPEFETRVRIFFYVSKKNQIRVSN